MTREQEFSVQRFFCKEGSQHWLGVFEEYTICTDRFIRVYSDQYVENNATDAPYWNIERTNIGMLAAACWKNGWVALEEFATVKKKIDKSDNGGRCDLWVSSQSGNKNYAIEAKKGSCSLDSKELIESLAEILDGEKNLKESACNDARKLNEDEGDERMGIAFMHLYLSESKQKKIEGLVEVVTKEVELYSQKDNGPDFVYLYLKDNGVRSDSGSIIPGVIIAGKKV